MSLNLKVEIITPKKKNQSDPLFYNDETIAEIEYGNYRFYAWACGDIRLTNKKTDEEYSNANVSDLFDLTDKEISDTFFNWENNNWFEISAQKKISNSETEFIDLMGIAHDYDEALEVLKTITENEIKKLVKEGNTE